jgi:hypothetical protein
MTDEVEVSGSAWGSLESKGNGGQQLDPEKGPTGAIFLLQEPAEKAVVDHLNDIVKCILANVTMQNLPNATLILDVAKQLMRGGEVTPEVCESLSMTLWNDVKKLYGDSTSQ